MTPLAIFVHGLPDIKKVPSTQLDALRPACQSKGYQVLDYSWAANSMRHIIDALRLLRYEDESFTGTQAKKFGNWFRGFLSSELPEDETLALLLYSVSGAFFYRWVCDEAGIEELRRISVAITVAAPHRFPKEIFLENHPDDAIPVNEQDISREDVVATLRRGGVQLKILLGGCDITIPEEYGTFQSYSDVDQRVIRFARHLSILSHPDTIDIASSWLT